MKMKMYFLVLLLIGANSLFANNNVWNPFDYRFHDEDDYFEEYKCCSYTEEMICDAIIENEFEICEEFMRECADIIDHLSGFKQAVYLAVSLNNELFLSFFLNNGFDFRSHGEFGLRLFYLSKANESIRNLLVQHGLIDDINHAMRQSWFFLEDYFIEMEDYEIIDLIEYGAEFPYTAIECFIKAGRKETAHRVVKSVLWDDGWGNGYVTDEQTYVEHEIRTENWNAVDFMVDEGFCLSEHALNLVMCCSLRGKNLKGLKFLEKWGMDFNKPFGPLKYTPLHFAVRYNNVEFARYLLNKHVDLWSKDYSGRTPLDLAVDCASDSTAYVILDELDGEIIPDGFLKNIVFRNRPGLIRKVFSSGFEFLPEYNRLLHLSDECSTLAALIDSGADPNFRCSKKQSLLSRQLLSQKWDCARLLIEKGAVVNEEELENCCHYEIIRSFLDEHL